MPATCASVSLSLSGTRTSRAHCSTAACLRLRSMAHCPRTFELVYGAQQLCKNAGFDAIIILGSVIRGDTPHFDYICQGVTFGISRLNATQNIPVIFGLLTTDDHQQALDRCGGKLGNKGDECAVDAIKMAKF